MRKIKKPLLIAAGILLLSASFGGYFLYQRSIKKAYDYSDYYVPVDVSVIEKEEEEIPDEVTEKELSLSLLKETNPDVVGIIEFDDRMIYEPVVQAPDNAYYVRKNIERQYAAAGIPFVTGEGTIDSTNVVIYGHSSTYDNIIFTPLMDYVNYSFYEEHPTFHFHTESSIRTYQIFAVLNVDTKDPYDTLEFAESEWRKETSYSSFLREMKNKSLYNTGMNVSTNDKIMTLVTCDTRNGNKRIVVLAKLIESV